MEVTFYFEADAQCAPLRCLRKFLYVGAAIGRPFGTKVTFVLDMGELPPPRSSAPPSAEGGSV